MGGFALLILGFGLVLLLEGLAFALAPSRIEEVLDLLRRLPAETRRTIGIAAMALGLALIWLARHLGA
ncbi:DUF2065 domain-containing protein [Albidovulum sediminicola]|uniref:DUF2065 domain-containing protein n=1 Tax=Albidovulum sediminicola TaxID=2984331 RepID=A0ABT2Z2S4_9RHOB|nr:DUF2065 domain-containing protein [Defluviimonas sp. WL0075]MCV2865424.1 DUF2065 domain-containing protein [Defluviimonas sp. WL0075]